MIRLANEGDIPALRDIYNYEILNNTATFDCDEKSYGDRVKWFNEHRGKYRLLVWDEDGTVGGYATLSVYNVRRAFFKTAEISVYIKKDFQGRGIGFALSEELLREAKEEKLFSTVVSQVTSDNFISKKLHKKLGFEYVGTLKDVGEKFGRSLSLDIYEYYL